MKNILLIVFVLFNITVFAQDQEYDVRKTRWGMSIIEVMSSEYPLTPDKSDENELEFKNVEL